jgi:hypothetical protein
MRPEQLASECERRGEHADERNQYGPQLGRLQPADEIANRQLLPARQWDAPPGRGSNDLPPF